MRSDIRNRLYGDQEDEIGKSTRGGTEIRKKTHREIRKMRKGNQAEEERRGVKIRKRI